jgi:hypothetical protein
VGEALVETVGPFGLETADLVVELMANDGERRVPIRGPRLASPAALRRL